MADPLRHRQTKGAETDMVDLRPPRHISTLPIADLRGDAISLTCCVLKRTLSSGTRVRTSWAGKLLTYGKKGVCYRTRYLLS
jgi:hypothetical protein